MTIEENIGARLLFRVEPIPLESPRGYVCRVADAQGYDSPTWLMRLAGFSGPAALDREHRARRIAHLLRLEPEEWLALSYRPVMGSGLPQRLFCGKPVSSKQLNWGRPRACPTCLREHSVWLAVWDLCSVAACPIHRCLLLDRCPGCKKMLAWQRPAVHECRCGLDLRTVTAERADTDLVAINALIYRAAGLSPGIEAERKINHYDFPPELNGLNLGSLLMLLGCAGFFGHEATVRRQQLSIRTDLNVAIKIDQTAVSLLRNWPHRFRAALKRMVPESSEDAGALRFHEIFGAFYFRLFRGLPRKEFGFFHDVFESFVREDWMGLVRGQHRFFSISTREKSPWVPVNQAAKEAHVAYHRIQALVRQGQIEGDFFRIRRGRIQCWVKRDSLKQWIAARDAEFDQHICLREVVRIFGLRAATVRQLAQAGLLHKAQDSGYGLPGGFHFSFSREEVIMKIKMAFEKYALPKQEYSIPAELIALGVAFRNYLGCSGLAAAIKAVVDGKLVPVAYTPRFPGITGYLFPSDHLRLYRPCVGKHRNDSRRLP